MKRWVYNFVILAALAASAFGQSYSLRVKEVDGTPNQPGVRTIIVSNGTLNCTGTTCTITTGGGSSGVAIGDTVTSGTTGSVLFVGSGPVLAQDNSNFFWDSTNHRLGVGTTTPGAPLSFPNSTGDKVFLYDNSGGGTAFGLGVQANQFTLFTNNQFDSFAFGYGSTSNSPTFTGTMYYTPAFGLWIHHTYVSNDDGELYVTSNAAARPVAVFQTASSPTQPIALFKNSSTAKLTVNTDGSLLQAGVAFASLGTPTDGTWVYCSDCTIANPCAGSGTGALAKRLNGVWVCN